jgi:hypothetical protein
MSVALEALVAAMMTGSVASLSWKRSHNTSYYITILGSVVWLLLQQRKKGVSTQQES